MPDQHLRTAYICDFAHMLIGRLGGRRVAAILCIGVGRGVAALIEKG